MRCVTEKFRERSVCTDEADWHSKRLTSLFRKYERLSSVAADNDAVVVGSIGSTEISGWVELAERMEDVGVPLLECNFGCPHPKMMPGVRTGMNVGQDFNYACEITQAVAEAVSMPVMIKVTPQVTDLVEFSGRLLDVGAKAVTLTNRFIGFVPDIETGKPLIWGQAGIGGPWVKPLTLRWVREVYLAHKDRVAIAGTNGAYDWRDIVMFVMSGADIVEMCSAVMVYGYEWLGKQVKGLDEWMDEKGYLNVAGRDEGNCRGSRSALCEYAP